MKIIITGGLGFLGSNLAQEAIKRSYQLTIVDNLSRLGSSQNLEWLSSVGAFEFCQLDLRNKTEIGALINKVKPDIIFHVAGQVAMTASLADPFNDFEINTLGTLHILEALRLHSPHTKLIYSSTNKVYGDLEQFDYEESETRYVCSKFPMGFNESLPLDFRTPYGCSKGAADQYIKDYALSFGLRTVVLRHSSIFGSRQFATESQGWIGWFVQQALNQKHGVGEESFTISGNGKQVRDVLFSDDLVNCYFRAIQRSDIFKGEVFNIGGGIDNSISILELIKSLEDTLALNLDYTFIAPRKSDQKFFVADISKAFTEFGWKPLVTKEEGIKQMIDWIRKI